MEKEVRKIILLFFLLIFLSISLFATNKSNKYDVSSSDYSSEIKKEYAKNFLGLITYGEYEMAYNLLTDDCKEELFENSLEKFTEEMQNKIYAYGRLPKTFTYEEPIKCLENGEEVYSQQVTISHRSIGTMIIDTSLFDYDINEYFKVQSINFIIYEEKPYDYKLYIQLIES